jgi:hypothetical protein
MHWGAYEVFSVLSGASALCLALFNNSEKPTQRVWIACAGVFFIGYGIYVANQRSGFYVFPVEIFIIPVGLAILGVVSLFSRRPSTAARPPNAARRTNATTEPAAQQTDTTGAERPQTPQAGDW